MTLKGNKALWLGLGVFLFAFVVRLVGIGWGLPNETHNQSFHPDEPVILGYAQQIEPSTFDFAPGFYNYGTLYLTLVRMTTDVVSAYSPVSEGNQPQAGNALVSNVLLAGRVLSTLAGAATAWVVLLMLLPRVGSMGAIVGGAAMAIAPGHVVHSRFQTVDVIATFFLALALLYALKLAPPNEVDGKSALRFALLSGLFAGLSAGTKYTGILALIALAVVVVCERKSLGWKPLVVGVLSALVAFFLTTPGALVESSAFLRDFKYEMTHTQTGHGLVFAGTPSGFVYHLWNLSMALGAVVATFGLVGLARASWQKHVWAIALFAFGLAYYLLIGRAEVKFMRYVFPLLPVLAVGFGWIIARAKESPKPFLQFGVVLVAVLGIASSLASVGQFTVWMVTDDPREAAASELRQEATVGLVSDPWFYTPPFYPGTSAGPYVEQKAGAFEVRKQWMDGATNPSVVRFLPSPPEQRIDFDKRLLTELRPDYVVFSSFEIGDLNRLNKLPSPPKEYETQLGRAEEFMDTLQTGYEIWKVHGSDGGALPHDLMYIRPEIQVWKRKTDSASPSTGSSTTSGQSVEPAPTP